MCGLKRNYLDVFHNSGNYVQESFKCQIFQGRVASEPARRVCCKVDHLMVEMNLLWEHHHDQYLANFFSLFKIAVSKLQILNMPIRTLLFFFIIVMYDIVKGLYSSNFAHIIAFFLEFNFFNVYDILILTNKKAKRPFHVSVDWSYYLLKYQLLTDTAIIFFVVFFIIILE